MRTIRITGTGSALPGRIVTNKELEQLVETSDEWIRERTGIAERHVSVGETVMTLASEAARKALEQAGKTAEEINTGSLSAYAWSHVYLCSLGYVPRL